MARRSIQATLLSVVSYSGSYELPFVSTLVLLCVGIVLWLRADPTRQVVPEQPTGGKQPVKLADAAFDAA